MTNTATLTYGMARTRVRRLNHPLTLSPAVYRRVARDLGLPSRPVGLHLDGMPVVVHRHLAECTSGDARPDRRRATAWYELRPDLSRM